MLSLRLRKMVARGGCPLMVYLSAQADRPAFGCALRYRTPGTPSSDNLKFWGVAKSTVSGQTYVKDMSARPLVVGAAAAVFCYASSHKTQAVRGLYNSHWDLEANSRPIAEDLSRRTAHCQHATPPQKGGIFRF